MFRSSLLIKQKRDRLIPNPDHDIAEFTYNGYESWIYDPNPHAVSQCYLAPNGAPVTVKNCTFSTYPDSEHPPVYDRVHDLFRVGGDQTHRPGQEYTTIATITYSADGYPDFVVTKKVHYVYPTIHIK